MSSPSSPLSSERFVRSYQGHRPTASLRLPHRRHSSFTKQLLFDHRGGPATQSLGLLRAASFVAISWQGAHILQSVCGSCREHLQAPQEIMPVSSSVLHSHLLFFQETCSSRMTVTHGLGADGRAATLTSCQIPWCLVC